MVLLPKDSCYIPGINTFYAQPSRTTFLMGHFGTMRSPCTISVKLEYIFLSKTLLVQIRISSDILRFKSFPTAIYKVTQRNVTPLHFSSPEIYVGCLFITGPKCDHDQICIFVYFISTEFIAVMFVGFKTYCISYHNYCTKVM